LKGKTNKPFIWQLLLLILLQILFSSCVSNQIPAITIAPTTPIIPTTSITTPITTTTAASTPSPEPSHIVVIDPGHGGDDWGTFHTNSAGKLDLLEKDVTLELGLQIANLLRAKGFTVILTRIGDISPNSPPRDLTGDDVIDENDDLQARINLANQSQGELFLSIHINSSDLGNEVGGGETW